jgi:CheY-like chemotaxis protein
MSAKILIVEDNPDSCAYLSHLLQVKGYTVFTASDGLQALNEVEAYDPDLIISDIMMPNVNGLQMVRALRQTSKYQGLPVLMISAYGSGNLREALDAGANQVMCKPLDFDVFFETLDRLLG